MIVFPLLIEAAKRRHEFVSYDPALTKPRFQGLRGVRK